MYSFCIFLNQYKKVNIKTNNLKKLKNHHVLRPRTLLELHLLEYDATTLGHLSAYSLRTLSITWGASVHS